MRALPRTLATLVVALTLTLGAAPSDAASRHRRPAPPQAPPIAYTFPEAVHACVAWMRTHGHPYVDAYPYKGPNGQDRVEPYVANDWDAFVLKKCLAVNGHAVEDVTLPNTTTPSPVPSPTVTPPVQPPPPQPINRTPMNPSNWPSYRASCEQKSSP